MKRVRIFAKLGIKTEVSLDLAAMMAHKDKVVGELTKGVEFLFKKNKVEGHRRRRRDRRPRPGRGEAAGRRRPARSKPRTSSSLPAPM